MKYLVATALTFFLLSCGGEQTPQTSSSGQSSEGAASARAVDYDIEELSTDAIAMEFVALALALGVYDEAYVDAYHGDKALRQSIEENPPSLDALEKQASVLLARLDTTLPEADGDKNDKRREMLRKQIVAAQTRIKMALGETFTFDEETKLLYDVVAPSYDIEQFDRALARIDVLLPGDAPLHERVDAFRNSLAIPADRLKDVFAAAIAECRKRTLVHYDLPASEKFSTGLVKDKPWSGYNWYQGDFESLIEINTDFPVIIDRAVDLGCHEGYPGHHTWNVLVERDFLNTAGWIEYSLYPLFSPQSLIGEGSANYGIELAFPGDEKANFERQVLYPLAGLDPDLADKMAELNEERRKLSHARNHVAREYLDGRIDRDTAIDLLTRYGLSSRERAEQGVRFIETYRGYVLNYNIGRDLVADYIEREAPGAGGRWQAFEKLLTTPISASDLAADETR